MIGTLVCLWGVLVGFDRIYQAPARLDSAEARIVVLETSDAEQSRRIDEQVRRVEYLVCDGLARAQKNGKTPEQCAADYITGREP